MKGCAGVAVACATSSEDMLEGDGGRELDNLELSLLTWCGRLSVWPIAGAELRRVGTE